VIKGKEEHLKKRALQCVEQGKTNQNRKKEILVILAPLP
jgi:hypothetical protein